MVAPRLLRLLRRRDPAQIVPAQLFDTLDDKIALKLGAARSIAERRRTLRAVDVEQVREVRTRHAEVRAGAARPFLLEGLSVRAAYVDAGQTARNGIEPRCQNQDVKLVFAFFRLYPGRSDPLDRGLAQVD